MEQRNSYAQNTGTATIKSSAGLLHGIVINQNGTSWEIEVYDGATTTAGTRIASIRSSSISDSFIYDVEFLTGLIIETVAGSTAGNLTVSYR